MGTLRGFDQFMNLVVDNTVEVNGNEQNDIGMVVSSSCSNNPVQFMQSLVLLLSFSLGCFVFLLFLKILKMYSFL